MGFLTTITFSNDAFEDFENNPDELVTGILKSMQGIENKTFHVGCHANPVIVQKPRHANDHTIYIHCGNNVIEVTEENIKKIYEQFPEYFKKLENIVKNKSKIFKEIKNK